VRPRLGGEAQRGEAPFLHVRVSPDLRRRVRRRAKELGVSPSRLVRLGLSVVLANNISPGEMSS
jgi:antitoxin component of RelBE/YafQ-DinJ toxin-antitoxin module